MNSGQRLLFGGMAQLGPGSNAATLHMLSLLPATRFNVVVDAGCGTGRQTLVVATKLGRLVHAVDSYEPFLADLRRRARDAGVGHLIETHLMDMSAIPSVFRDVDLLWSEGAAYNIGFENALVCWSAALSRGGFAVVSELSWLCAEAPRAVREFFRSGYPAMQSVQQNVVAAERAGYTVHGRHALPREAWVTGYYDVLGPRARALMKHPDPSVRDLARETVKEIEIFERSEDSYGYVFYLLERR